MQVIRGGRRVKISIYDVVVGDVVPLKIGNQVKIIDFSVFGLIIYCFGMVISFIVWDTGACRWNIHIWSFSGD